jgi:hypothetical protein
MKTSISSCRQIIIPLLILFAFINTGRAQPQKTLHTHYQFWTSINTITELNTHWAVIADVHIRRNHFMEDPGFYFIRAGLGYFFCKNLYVVGGYGHMWLASAIQQHYVYAGENRFYQQVQYSLDYKRIHLTQRVRNEQRWQQKIMNGKPTGYDRFSNRIRYLVSLTVPLTKNSHGPSLVVADEAALHFGKEIIYNRFDQNRIFLGMKQKLTPSLSFDLGYMYINQKKYTAHEWDQNHTLRFFFYYSPQL